MMMIKKKEKPDSAKSTQTFEEQIQLAATAEAFSVGRRKK